MKTPVSQTIQAAPATHLDEAMLILHELDRALAFHLQWLKNLHRTLICGEPAHDEDLAHDAHCQCNYGRWFYSLSDAFLNKEPGIAELETPHKAMHDAARTLLLAHQAGETIRPDRYETFMDLSTGFKQQMRAYQFGLIQRICSVDHLTGVWNRNSMAMQLAAEAERARRGHQHCAICLLDLDHFKHVNDQYGHLAGDRVLQDVARFLKGNLRTYDSMFRYGGEEFLICLPNIKTKEAEPLLNRLREKLSATAITLPNGHEIHITASFGVAAIEPDEDVTHAIERADHALLCAKSKGRNRVCIWSIQDKLATSADQPDSGT